MVAFIERLSTIGGIIAAILIALAIAVVCQMVFLRYALESSAIWQTEFVTFSLVGATLIGSAYVMKERGHVAVELATVHAPPAARRLMIITADLVVLILALIMIWKSSELTWDAYKGRWTSESTFEFMMWKPYLAMPVGFVLLALQCVACMMRAWHDDTPAERRH